MSSETLKYKLAGDVTDSDSYLLDGVLYFDPHALRPKQTLTSMDLVGDRTFVIQPSTNVDMHVQIIGIRTQINSCSAESPDQLFVGFLAWS